MTFRGSTVAFLSLHDFVFNVKRGPLSARIRETRAENIIALEIDKLSMVPHQPSGLQIAGHITEGTCCTPTSPWQLAVDVGILLHISGDYEKTHQEEKRVPQPGRATMLKCVLLTQLFLSVPGKLSFSAKRQDAEVLGSSWFTGYLGGSSTHRWSGVYLLWLQPERCGKCLDASSFRQCLPTDRYSEHDRISGAA